MENWLRTIVDAVFTKYHDLLCRIQKVHYILLQVPILSVSTKIQRYSCGIQKSLSRKFHLLHFFIMSYIFELVRVHFWLYMYMKYLLLDIIEVYRILLHWTSISSKKHHRKQNRDTQTYMYVHIDTWTSRTKVIYVVHCLYPDNYNKQCLLIYNMGPSFVTQDLFRLLHVINNYRSNDRKIFV